MPVYDRHGNLLTRIFDRHGNELLSAYDHNGNLVYTKGTPEPTGEVALHGKLTKKGKYLVDKDSRQMEIRAVGIHHILQYSNLHTLDAIRSLRSYGCNCLRISVYLEDWLFASSDNQLAFGYISKPTETKRAIDKLIGICTQLGMYVLLDWHVLGSGTNGQSAPVGAEALHQTEAEEFFTYFARKYADYPNIMYELANEPYKQTWAMCLPFIQSVRSIIKTYVTDPVMVMNICQNTTLPSFYGNLVSNGLTDIFVSDHQYGQNKTTQYTEWWNNGYPLFNTEWGNSSSSGDGTGSDANSIAMLEWYHTNGVPHGVWKFTDQTMTTSFLNNLGTINSPTYADGFDDSDLSHNGTLFLKRFQSYATTDYIERDIIS